MDIDCPDDIKMVAKTPGSLSYEIFTLPWLQRTLQTDDESVSAELESQTLPDL